MLLDARNCCEESARVFAGRGGEHGLWIAFIDESSFLHHANPVAYVFYHCEIVRYQDYGKPKIAAKVAQKVQDSCLHGYVECANRLVGDKYARFASKGARYRHSLTLPARHLPRVLL